MSYNATDNAPTISRITLPSPLMPSQSLRPPILTGGNTEGLVSGGSVTYNEAGITYNELGLTYGGVYGNTDKIPIVNYAPFDRPVIARDYGQAGTVVVPPTPPGSGMLIGMLGLTYP